MTGAGRAAAALGVALATAAAAGGGIVGTLNAVRARGCAGRSGLASPLRADPRLDVAAERLARGDGLERALGRAGYRAVRAASISLGGVEDADLAEALAEGSCKRILDAALRDVGARREGRSLWIVLAEPLARDELADADRVRRRVLALVNDARSHPRRCGDRAFGAAPPLVAAAVLRRIAEAHARDMAARSVLAHEDAHGAGPGERATRAGYAWREVGENVASGTTTPGDVVRGWLGSPGHCANLMSPRFVETGIGFAVDEASEGGVYWAQLFAAPAP